jgi:hypothetical protein
LIPESRECSSADSVPAVLASLAAIIISFIAHKAQASRTGQMSLIGSSSLHVAIVISIVVIIPSCRFDRPVGQ